MTSAGLVSAGIAPGRSLGAAAFPDGAQLVVAGPEGGRLDRWAAAIAPTLGAALPAGTELRRLSLGGVDGVTGANRFDARAVSDGSAVLMVPGDAALAWLAGDPRAQFDAAHWLPVFGGAGPAVVAGRVRAGDLTGRRPLRVAGAGPAGPALPALLGLDLLGVPTAAVCDAADERDADRALADGRADLALFRGGSIAGRLNALAGAEVMPLFSLTAPDAADPSARAAGFADTPSFEELHLAMRGAAPSGPLFAAWRAAAAATQLAFGLVLPQLTPAAMVALWRRAGQSTARAPDVRLATAVDGIRPLPPQAALASTRTVAVEADTLLELRAWLATRWNWQPA